MKKMTGISIVSMVCLGLLAAAGPASAKGRRYDVTVTNLTRGQVITPPVVISHRGAFDLFTLGEAAPPELVELAEDGATASLEALPATLPSVHAAAVAAGVILPGESATVRIATRGRSDLLSAAAMLATTNDAFVAFRDVRAPAAGKRTFYALAYDAGSETNSESCASIPGPPCNNPNVRDTSGAEGYVHVHSGIHGTGDLVPATHDWRNPVAVITVRRVR